MQASLLSFMNTKPNGVKVMESLAFANSTISSSSSSFSKNEVQVKYVAFNYFWGTYLWNLYSDVNHLLWYGWHNQLRRYLIRYIEKHARKSPRRTMLLVAYNGMHSALDERDRDHKLSFWGLTWYKQKSICLIKLNYRNLYQTCFYIAIFIDLIVVNKCT